MVDNNWQPYLKTKSNMSNLIPKKGSQKYNWYPYLKTKSNMNICFKNKRNKLDLHRIIILTGIKQQKVYSVE